MDSMFPRQYECEAVDELVPSPSTRRIHFPQSASDGLFSSVLLKVAPASGKSWIGAFQSGGYGPMGVNGVFTTPNPDVFCVSVDGRGYLLHASTPATWSEVAAFPILDVRQIPRLGLIVFSDFTDLVTYGDSGIRWKNRLGADGLKIEEVSDAEIRGSWWNPASQTRDAFVVDARSGNLLSGARWKM